MKYLSYAFFAAALFVSCKKDPNVIPDSKQVKSANFNVDGYTTFMAQKVAFEAVDTLGGSAYYWNYGDGTKETSKYAVKHVYNNAGTYYVTLTVQGFTNTQKVVISKGNVSYQVKNNTKRNIGIDSYVDMPDNGSKVHLDLPQSAISDTLYANTAIKGNLPHIYSVSVVISGKSYLVYNAPWLKEKQNNIVTLTDTTKVLISSKSDVVTTIDKL